MSKLPLLSAAKSLELRDVTWKFPSKLQRNDHRRNNLLEANWSHNAVPCRYVRAGLIFKCTYKTGCRWNGNSGCQSTSPFLPSSFWSSSFSSPSIIVSSMTPHASRCCRALKRQIASPKDSIWISDSLLAAAFDRFCVASKTWQRRFSNLPGPLESRRRLGKRQIGDLGLQSASSAPGWAFETPLNLSKWQWEPPQLALELEQRQSGRDKSDTAGLFSPLLKSLGQWAAEIVEESPPPLPDISTPVAETSRRQPPFQADLDAFMWSIANAPRELLVSDTTNLCHKFQRSIYLGELLAGDVVLISKQIWGALDSRFMGSQEDAHLYFSLYSAVVTGVTTSKVFDAKLLRPAFWNTLLVRMSVLPVGEELCDLFGQVLNAVRHIRRGGVREGVLSVLGRFFSSWAFQDSGADLSEAARLLEVSCSSSMRVEQTLSALRSSLAAKAGVVDGHILHRARTQLAHANISLRSAENALSVTFNNVRALSEALESVGPGESAAVLDAAIKLVQVQPSMSASRQWDLRYNWLSVLAQLPYVRQDAFFEALALLSPDSPGSGPPCGTELCSLLIFQWESRGYLKAQDKVQQRYGDLCSGHDDMALGSLVLAIFKSSISHEARRGLYASVWNLLTKLGRLDDMGESLKALSHTYQVPRDLLRALSAASRDHHVALRLQELYTHHLRRTGGPEWDPSLFNKHAQNIVLDPSLPASTLWQALNIDKLERSVPDLPARRSRHRGTYGAHRAAIVSRVVELLSEKRGLPSRVAFRQVSQCMRFLEEVKGTAPAPAIRAFYRTVARDLMEGRPGRTTRLLWFLKVVERNCGFKISLASRHAIKRWRFRLRRLWLWRQKRGNTERGSVMPHNERA